MLKPQKLGKDFLSSLDLNKDQTIYILDLAEKLKKKELVINLKDKVLGLIFDKSSTRTRVSFQVAMTRLGGTTIDLNPNLWEGYHNLIKILRSLNKPKEAANLAEKARNLFSSNHLFDGLLGEINSDIGNFEEAIKNFKEAIKKAPDDDENIYSYANFLIGIGRKKEGIPYLKRVLEINPKHAITYYSLSTLISKEEDNFLTNKILNINVNNFSSNFDLYTILFAKSNIFHKKKEYEKSADLLKQGNDLKLLDKPSDLEENIKFWEKLKEKIDLDKSFDLPKFKFLRDIFIVGLPRSGSTLIESILGMNKDVYNLGEKTVLLSAMKESEESNYSNIDQIYLKICQNFSSKK